mgnify:CR=1 FL=1
MKIKTLISFSALLPLVAFANHGHYSHPAHHRDPDHMFIEVNLPAKESSPRLSHHAIPNRPGFPARWVDARVGSPIPANAVSGGIRHGEPFYICRGTFEGGVHPGKVVGGKCDISFGGQEVRLFKYQVLVNPKRLSWVAQRFAGTPLNAIQGGFERDGTHIYICRTSFKGSLYPGKVVKHLCHIAWNGKEIPVSNYQILVYNQR